MKEFRVGIIGYGWAAQAHIEAINATTQAEVGAVFSSRKLDTNEIRSTHGAAVECHNSLDALLADSRINTVSITGYPALHKEQAVAAAKAGKHLIIEKPLALSLEDAREIRNAVRENGVQACVCFECRWSSQFQATKAILDEGLLGEIHYGEVDYFHGIGPWYGQYRWNTTRENGGSSLLSAGCHAMDALLLCMGGEVKTVTSYAAQSENLIFSAYEYPTTTTTILQFSDGRVGKVASVIDCLQPYYFHTHLVGSAGSLLDDKFHSEKLHAEKSRWSRISMKMLDSGDVSDHPYQAQFQVFFDALEKNEPMPLTSLEEAYKSFEVVFAADRSAANQCPVNLSDLR